MSKFIQDQHILDGLPGSHNKIKSNTLNLSAVGIRPEGQHGECSKIPLPQIPETSEEVDSSAENPENSSKKVSQVIREEPELSKLESSAPEQGKAESSALEQGRAESSALEQGRAESSAAEQSRASHIHKVVEQVSERTEQVEISVEDSQITDNTEVLEETFAPKEETTSALTLPIEQVAEVQQDLQLSTMAAEMPESGRGGKSSSKSRSMALDRISAQVAMEQEIGGNVELPGTVPEPEEQTPSSSGLASVFRQDSSSTIRQSLSSIPEANADLHRRAKIFGDIPRADSKTSIHNFRRIGGAVGKATTAIKPLKHGLTKEDLGQNVNGSLLYETIRPLFILMKMGGIFYSRPVNTVPYQRNKCGVWMTQQVYCHLMFIFLVVCFIRSLFIFLPGDSLTYIVFKSSWVMFWWECATRAFTNLKHCRRSKHGIEDFILKLGRTCYSDGIVPYDGDVKSLQWWLIGYTFCTAACYAALCGVGFYGPMDIQHIFKGSLWPAPEEVSSSSSHIWKGTFIGLVFVGCWLSNLSKVFFIIICYVLYKEFECLCRAFAIKIREDGQFADDLEKFRIMHQKRCKLVEDADELFKGYIANAYLTQIAVMCLMAYSVFYLEQESTQRYPGVFFLVFNILQMSVITVAAIMISTQAHAPLEYIHSVSGQTINTERQLVVNMFLNRLTGTSIGLTAWDMFVLNKPTMLTIVGIIFTFIFLLVQIQIDVDNSCTCQFRDHNNTIYHLKPIRIGPPL